MINLLDTFFEYVAIREQRERLMTQLGVLGVTVSACYVIAVIAYINLR
jgi:hypothetical protein